MPRRRGHSVEPKHLVVAEYHAGESVHALARRRDLSCNRIAVRGLALSCDFALRAQRAHGIHWRTLNMATCLAVAGAIGGGAPVILGTLAIADLPAASSDLIGALAIVTGTAHSTETGKLAVRIGTTWEYAPDGVTTIA